MGFLIFILHWVPKIRQRSWEAAHLFGRDPDSELQFGDSLLDYACFFFESILEIFISNI